VIASAVGGDEGIEVSPPEHPRWIAEAATLVVRERQRGRATGLGVLPVLGDQRGDPGVAAEGGGTLVSKMVAKSSFMLTTVHPLALALASAFSAPLV
jgi:hypothetical protein